MQVCEWFWNEERKLKVLPPLLNPSNTFEDTLQEILNLGVMLRGTGRQALERTDTTGFTWSTAITSCFRLYFSGDFQLGVPLKKHSTKIQQPSVTLRETLGDKLLVKHLVIH